jgi:type I restriction enzyme S subunit
MQLIEVCELIIDCEHKTAPTQETGHPSIRTPNIGDGYFILENVNRVSNETYALWTKRAIPQPGDLIMAREAPVGNVAIIPEGLRPCLGQRTLLIRPDRSKVDPYFLNYFLNGPHVQSLIHAKTNGATVAHLNMKDVRNMDLPQLPALPIQRRIAGILAIYDELIENSQRRIRILETMARSLYREWFVNFRFPGYEKMRRVPSALGDIPKGWLSPLHEHVDFKEGPGLRNWQYRNQGTPFLNIRTLIDNDIDFSKIQYLDPQEVDDKYQHFLLREYDHVVSSSGTIGRIVTVRAEHLPLMLNTSTIRMRPKGDRMGRWLLKHFMLSNYFQDQAKSFAIGAAQANFGPSHLKQMQIVAPDDNVAVEYERLVAPLELHVMVLARQIRNLRRTRDLLLPRLLSGQIAFPLGGAGSKMNNPAACSVEPLVLGIETSPYAAAMTTPLRASDKQLFERGPVIGDPKRTEVLCAIRTLFNDGEERERDIAIRELAHALGYQRTGSRVYEVLSTDLLTAARRGIIVNVGGVYRRGFRTLADCTRDSLKKDFESAIGRGWISRDDAIRSLARWLGFARGGPIIEETTRSLINGLIREGRLETDGAELIRRT